MKSFVKVAGLATAALWAAGAQATLNIQVGDSVTINGTIESGKNDIGYVKWYNPKTSVFSTEYCYAGAFSVRATDGSQSAQIETFCTDVGVNWRVNTPVPYTARDFADTQSTGVYPPWSHNPQSIDNAAWIYNNEFVNHLNTQGFYAGTAAEAAGIQLAIWKVLYDTASDGTLGTSFGTGKLQASGFSSASMNDAVADITALLNARANHTFSTYTSTWLDPINGDSQGLIWTPSTPNSDVNPVPEPTTMIAGALLLLPFGASTIRVLRRNRKA